MRFTVPRIGAGVALAGALGATLSATVVNDGAGREPSRQPAPSCPCAVTRPDTDGRRDGVHGTRALATTLGRQATIVAALDPAKRPPGTMVGRHQSDGSVYAKFLWTRGARGDGALRVTGRELQTGDAGLKVRVDRRLRDSPYIPSVLVFPREGCWQIVARAGKAHLSFVVRVIDELN